MSSDLIIVRPPSPQCSGKSRCIASSFRTLPNRYQAVKAQYPKRCITGNQAAEIAVRRQPDQPPEHSRRQPEETQAAFALGLEVHHLEALGEVVLLLQMPHRLGLAAELIDELGRQRLAT